MRDCLHFAYALRVSDTPQPSSPQPDHAASGEQPPAQQEAPNTTPLAAREPTASPATPAQQRKPYQLNEPPAQFERFMVDQAAKMMAPLQARIAELETQLAQRVPANAPAPSEQRSVAPIFRQQARSQMGDHTDESLVEELAEALSESAKWWSLRSDPDQGVKAREAMRRWESRAKELRFRASYLADKAAADAQRKQAEGSTTPEPLGMSVGEAMRVYRQTLTAEQLKDSCPSISRAMSEGRITAAMILDPIDIGQMQTAEELVAALDQSLAHLERFADSVNTSASPAESLAPANPGALAPSTPAAAGHTGRGNILDRDQYQNEFMAAAAGMTQ